MVGFEYLRAYYHQYVFIQDTYVIALTRSSYIRYLSHELARVTRTVRIASVKYATLQSYLRIAVGL